MLLNIRIRRFSLVIARNTTRAPFRKTWGRKYSNPWMMYWTPIIFVMFAWRRYS